MLKEKLCYEDQLPVNVIAAAISEYPIHFHEDLELVCLLSGSMTLRNGYYTHTMRPGDIFVFNDRELHSFRATDEPNAAVILQIDSSYFSGVYPDLKTGFFVTDTDGPDTPEMDELRTVLIRIVMAFFSDGTDRAARVVEHTHSLLSLLMEEFRCFSMENGRFVNVSKNRTNKILTGRMHRIQDYLYANYSKKLTLREIAEREHLSVYYLSHVIKSATGLSFKEFLGFIRVEESEKYLLGTDMKIPDVSDAVGFSAVRYYEKYFAKWFGMSPGEYRMTHPDHAGNRNPAAVYSKLGGDTIKAAIKEKFNDVYREYAAVSRLPAMVISVNLNETKGFDPSKADPLLRMLRDLRDGGELSGSSDNRGIPGAADGSDTERIAHPAALLFEMWESLGERIIDAGGRHIISVGGCETPGSKTGTGAAGVSILLWNADAGDGRERTELLVRLVGLSGMYDVRRISYEGRGAAAATERRKSQNGKETRARARNAKREALCRRVDTFPTVAHTRMKVTKRLTLQVESELSGAVLILIDQNIPDGTEHPDPACQLHQTR
ncbi:MAG: AraC family transcriptional regulator [Clostridiales Family XIII bacterium]|jgi:AraC-like DNA-binding protein|nr:AraC family transcriptional regulator [Clostridiales Family XIII bacterium]